MLDTMRDHVLSSFRAPALAFVLFLAHAAGAQSPAPAAPPRHNVIVFVADGLRRGSVTAEVMPTFWKVRTEGVDFANSHSVFPTFTTANASVIATGHGTGDTGDYSNTIYTGVWLARPENQGQGGQIVPFLENDETLADMNAAFGGNYLGEKTLLDVARENGYAVASVGKLGPTAIQQIGSVGWDDAGVTANGAIILDDSTGQKNGIALPLDVMEAMEKAGLGVEAPSRNNGYADSSNHSNAFVGDAVTPGTIESNHGQQQWLVDVATKVLLPKFTGEGKPFVLLFWSRDPDGSQHDEGDSLQQLIPGINGPTATAGLRNADHDLKQLLDWLDAHPEVKANTDVLLTSDHGFATISRREIAADHTQTGEPSAALTYELSGKEKAEPAGTLPTGFLAVDLAVREHLRLFDPAVRATAGPSPYVELMVGGERSQHPSTGSALLGDAVKSLDGSDAKLIVASNGGSDLVYVPTGNADVVHATLAVLTQLDYVGGIFVDDKYCAKAEDCPGALKLSDVGMVGSSQVPRPAIAVTYKVFYGTAGDLQSAAQVSDTGLQEGQGMHGGFGREQTLNNMAAMGPDFKAGFVDAEAMGNIDIAPTLAEVLGIKLPSVGSNRGRVVQEALRGGEAAKAEAVKTMVSAPSANGMVTVLVYQEAAGKRYNDRACLVAVGAAKVCP
jgi:arylsulfatase A-like enzyme